MPGFVIQEGAQKGQALVLRPGGPIRVGSDPECELRIIDAGVAPLTCVIHANAGKFALLDKTGNGLEINDARVQKKILATGDRIRLGGALLVFHEKFQDALLGKNLGGYRIDARLGRDSIGTLYRATQLSVERTVVLKVLAPKLARDRNFVMEFLQEARSAGRLNHPNLVQVHDVSQEENFLFYSTEYLPGGNLAQLLKKEGRVPCDRALDLMANATRALLHGAEHGIIHGDLKPANLQLSQDGRLKVVGIGIASAHKRTQATAGAMPATTIPYLAPEQIFGGKFDQRADIYALGSSFYHVFSGRPPFRGASAKELLNNKTLKDPPPLSVVAKDLPEGVSSLIARMMERDPEKRQQSFAEVLEEIERLQDEDAASEGTAGFLRTRAGQVAAALVLCIALVGAFYALFSGDTARDEQTSPDRGDSVATEFPPVAPPRDDEVDESSAARVQEGLNKLQAAYDLFERDLLKWTDAEQRLEAVQTEYAHRDVAAKARELLERGRSSHAEAVSEEITTRLAGELQPALQAKNYVQATKTLDDWKEVYPEHQEALERKRAEILALARGELTPLMASVDAAVGRAAFDEALALLEPLSKRFPPPLTSEIDARREAVVEARESFDKLAAALDEAEVAVHTHLAKLDLAAAEASAAAPGSDILAALRSRHAVLEREVRLAGGTLKKLKSAVEKRKEVARPWKVSFYDDPDAAGEFTLVEIDAGSHTLALKSGRSTTRRELLSLANETLRDLLLENDTAVASPELSENELNEGLGWLLGHAWGPNRALQWLLALPHLAVEERETHGARLQRIGEQQLVAAMAENEKDLATLTAAGDAVAGRQWYVRSKRVEHLIREHRGLPHYNESRQLLAEQFMAFYKEVLRTRGLKTVFHVDTVKLGPDGTIEVSYDFSDVEQLKAFVQNDPDSAARIQSGVLRLMGEYRLLRGDPFMGWIEVSVEVAEDYAPNSANINVAVWTSDARAGGKRVTFSNKKYEGEPSVEPTDDDFFVFGMGYAPKNMPRLSLAIGDSGRSCEMPALVIIGGTYGTRLHDGDRWTCLWGESMRSLSGRPSMDISLHPEKAEFLSWKTSARRRPVTSRSGELQRLKRQDSKGSVTLFTNGEIVGYSKLVVRSKLNPEWVEMDLGMRAEWRLRRFEPDFPFPVEVENTTPPVEEAATGVEETTPATPPTTGNETGAAATGSADEGR